VQLLFAQEAGTSLTRFVNEMRIEAAHQLLLQADHQSNVTQIALDCGFNHTGLFSAAYRRVYGELPRDTLARARRGAGVPSSFDPRFEVAS
jgi:AraC-like DNA-binding protein